MSSYCEFAGRPCSSGMLNQSTRYLQLGDELWRQRVTPVSFRVNFCPGLKRDRAWRPLWSVGKETKLFSDFRPGVADAHDAISRQAARRGQRNSARSSSRELQGADSGACVSPASPGLDPLLASQTLPRSLGTDDSRSGRKRRATITPDLAPQPARRQPPHGVPPPVSSGQSNCPRPGCILPELLHLPRDSHTAATNSSLS